MKIDHRSEPGFILKIEGVDQIMRGVRITTVANLIALCLLASATALGATGDKAEIKGVIISRTAETFIMSGPNQQGAR